MPDFLALTGDSADGIPGLPGFGEKTAAILMGAYEHLELIPEQPELWPVAVRRAAQLASMFVERREDALLYRRLATLVAVEAVGVAVSINADALLAGAGELGNASLQPPSRVRSGQSLALCAK